MVMDQVALRHQLLFHHDWKPNFRSHPCLAPLKERRRYAYDGEWVFVDFNGLAHDAWIRTEMRLPQPVTDYHHRRVSRLLVLGGQKAAPQDRPPAQYIEVIGRRYHAPHALRFTFARQARGSEAARRDARKTLLPVADRLDIRIGKRERVLSRLAQRQGHHVARAGKPGNWIQQCRIDPAENGGIRANPQRKS